MYNDNPYLEKPDDENIKIWRYMDLAKFLSLIEKSALYFTKADQFDDPFEGMYFKTNLEDLKPKNDNERIQMHDDLKLSQDNAKNYLRINCWNISSYESPGLWGRYGEDYGIAVQSTFKRLISSFKNTNKEITIGKVKYIDTTIEKIPYGNIYYLFTHKKIEYAYENELRAFLNLTATDNFDEILRLGGIYVKIDLDILIEKIVVEDKTPDWHTDLIRSILKTFKLNKDVVYSSLREKPPLK